MCLNAWLCDVPVSSDPKSARQAVRENRLPCQVESGSKTLRTRFVGHQRDVSSLELQVTVLVRFCIELSV
jgi:hypothetical protein